MKSRPYLMIVLIMTLALAACASESADGVEVSEEVQPGEATEAAAENIPAPASSPAPTRASEPARVAAASAAPPAAAPAPAPPPAPAPEPEPEPTIISSGTPMQIMLIDPISTETNLSGDEFLAELDVPISVNGSIVVQEGVRVRGRILDVQKPGRVRGRARIEMVLFEILGQNGRIPISTVAYVEEAEQNLGRDATLGAAGTAAGAIVGGITGGKAGAIIGGAAGGAGTVMATRGDQLEYPAESRLRFTLSEAVEIPAGQTIS